MTGGQFRTDESADKQVSQWERGRGVYLCTPLAGINKKVSSCTISVADPKQFDMDPDLSFYVDADPEPDPNLNLVKHKK